MKKVYITGLGAMTSLGNSVEEGWQSVLAGNSGIGSVSQSDLDNFPFNKGAEVKNYRARDLVKDRKLLKLINRQDVLGLAAADQAIEQSRIMTAPDENTGVYVGSPGNKYFQQYDFMSLLAKSDDDLTKFADHLFEEVHPMWLLKILPNNVLAYTGIQYGFKGPNQNVTNHVVGGLQALIEAYYAIQTGQTDRAVVVAYDVGFEPQAQRYYGQLGILSNDHLKPFDEKHNGTILGEAAVALVLESETSCQTRQAAPFAEMLAGQTTGDAHGIFAVDEQAKGIMSLMNNLYQKSGITPSELGMIVAHANGNKKSDITESIAIHELASDTAVTGFKWAFGHTLCASGLLDTVFATKALQEKNVPGVAAFDKLSNECAPISVVSNSKALTHPSCMIINRGFGSLNTGIVLRGTE